MNGISSSFVNYLQMYVDLIITAHMCSRVGCALHRTRNSIHSYEYTYRFINTYVYVYAVESNSAQCEQTHRYSDS
jgi:hypothetical protein